MALEEKDIELTHEPTWKLRVLREYEWVSDEHTRPRDRLQRLWMPKDPTEHFFEWADVPVVKEG